MAGTYSQIYIQIVFAVQGRQKRISDSSLADLYDPSTMPKVLVDAHRALDKAVTFVIVPKPSKPNWNGWNFCSRCIVSTPSR
jgi:restriction-modification enzyme MmeI-like protein